MSRKRDKRGSPGKRIPIVPCMIGGLLAAEVVAQGESGGFEYAGSPVGFMKEGNMAAAANAIGRNLTRPGTYTAIAIPLAFEVVGKMLVGKVPIGKKVSLF